MIPLGATNEVLDCLPVQTAGCGCQGPNPASQPPAEARSVGAAASRPGNTKNPPGSTSVSPDLDTILGKWKHPEKAVIVEIAESDGLLTGHVVSTPQGPPQKAVAIFRDLRFAPDEGVWKGRIFVPERGREVNATWRADAGQLSIAVSVGTFTRRITWSRP